MSKAKVCECEPQCKDYQWHLYKISGFLDKSPWGRYLDERRKKEADLLGQQGKEAGK